ncbi:MAG: EamA family transporter [Rhodospirillales bacterium]|jgi:drug/metabolite transporter (DMT)-like permease|nr:EamA family transporter [Rhodospirillales bacterium]MDP6883579.1 EamA family transporter [Rhodospirillales bacterium]
MGRSLALLVLLSAIWSSPFVFIKIGVETVPPLTMTVGRVVLASVVLYAVLRWRRQSLPGGGRLWGMFIGLAVLGNALPFTLIAWGEERIDSGLAAILMAVMPLATVILTHFFTADERAGVAKVLGVAVGLAGVAFLVGTEALRGLGGDVWRQLGVAGAALSYAAAATLARRLPPLTPVVRTTAVMLCGCLVMIPLALAFERPWTLGPSTESVVSIVYLGLVPTALGTILYFRLISDAGATFVSFVNYLIPVLGVLWGFLFLDERVSVQALVSMAAILAGIAIATLRPRPARPSGYP